MSSKGDRKKTYGGFKGVKGNKFNREKFAKGSQPSEYQNNPRLAPGLIMISGYTENGVDESKCDFRKFINVWETFLRTNYPKLTSTASKPFNNDIVVAVPKEIQKKHEGVTTRADASTISEPKKKKSSKRNLADDEEEGAERMAETRVLSGFELLDDESRAIYLSELVKQYMKDCKALEEAKQEAAGHLWSTCPRALQETINLQAERELKDKLENDEEISEFNLEQFEREHSRFNYLWLWRSIVQIMSLGVDARETAPELRGKAKRAIETLKMLKTESITEYRQRFEGAYDRYEAIVARVGDGIREAELCRDFVYESNPDRAARFINTLDASRYLEFVTDYRNNISRGGVYNSVQGVIDDALQYRVIRTISTKGHHGGNSSHEEVAVLIGSVPNSKKKPKKLDPKKSNSGGGQETKKEKPSGGDEKEKKSNGGKFDKSQITCWKCAAKGHFESECPRKDLPPTEKFQKREEERASYYAENASDPFIAMVQEVEEEPEENLILDVTNVKKRKLGERDIILDTGCEARGLFRNSDLLVNVRAAGKTIRIIGIDGDKTGIISNLVGDHPDFGVVNVCTAAHANVLSGAMLMDNHEVDIGKDEIRVFVRSASVSVPSTVYHFRRRGLLFVCNVDRDVETVATVLSTSIETVRDRERMFSRRELVGARRAREIKLNSGLLSNRDIAKIPWRGMGIVPADVERAEFIYGRDFDTAAGRTTQRDHGVKTEYVPLSEAPIATQETYADLFAIGELWFVMVVLKPLDYYNVQPVENQSHDGLMCMMRKRC